MAEPPPRKGTLPELQEVADWAGKAFADSIRTLIADGRLDPSAAAELCAAVVEYDLPYLHDGEGLRALSGIQSRLAKVGVEAMRLALASSSEATPPSANSG